MKKSLFMWAVTLTAVIILLQTLYFKFSAAPESVYIFSTLGAEPYGRIGSGIIELLASLLLLVPRTRLLGAILGASTMAGALASHILFLGVEIKNDGGTLFILAIITFLCCLILIYDQKSKLRNYWPIKM